MLRILILVSACIRSMAFPSPQKEPYFYRMPSNQPTPPQPYTTPTIAIKPVSTKPVYNFNNNGRRFMDPYVFQSLSKRENKVNEEIVNKFEARRDIQIPINTRFAQHQSLPVKLVQPSEPTVTVTKSQVLTEKPVSGNNIANLDRSGKPSYSIKIPVTNPPTDKEEILKAKLMSLLMSSKKDVDTQSEEIQSIHNTFKHRTMYKVGYLTNLINKLNNKISQLYEKVENDDEGWDSLRILDAYEKVKKNNEMIQNLLDVMETFLRVKTSKRGKTTLKGHGTRVSPPKNLGISWSYYDDTMP